MSAERSPCDMGADPLAELAEHAAAYRLGVLHRYPDVTEEAAAALGDAAERLLARVGRGEVSVHRGPCTG